MQYQFPEQRNTKRQPGHGYSAQFLAKKGDILRLQANKEQHDIAVHHYVQGKGISHFFNILETLQSRLFCNLRINLTAFRIFYSYWRRCKVKYLRWLPVQKYSQ